MKYISAKISDKMNEYYKTGRVTASFFMDPSEMVEAESVLRNVEYACYGGYDDAERKVILIGVSKEDDTSFTEIVERYLCVIRVCPHANLSASSGTGIVRLSHRSVLGSVLGLGIKREMVGDILVGEKSCDIIVVKSIAEFLVNQLQYVGREKVRVQELEISELHQVEENEKEISASVSSLRLDAVISAGFGIAREKSNALVKGELVKLNHMVVTSPTRTVSEGDIISVRGKRQVGSKGNCRPY